jgi:flagellar biosynthesis protein FlhF
MAQALAAVRQDLGTHAVILHTRTFKAGGFLGIGRRSVVEVTARSGEAPTSAKSRPAVMRKAEAAREAYQRVAGVKNPGQRHDDRSSGNAATAPRSSEASEPVVPDRERIRRLAMAMAEKHDRKQASRTPVTPNAKLLEVKRHVTPEPRESAEQDKLIRADCVEPVARRYVLKAADAVRGRTESLVVPCPLNQSPSQQAAIADSPCSSRGSTRGRGVTTVAVSSLPEGSSMQNELAAIRDMVGQVLQRQVTAAPANATPSMPRALFDMYLRLVAQDVSQELADQIVASVQAEIGKDLLDDQQAIRAAALRQLAAIIPSAEAAAPTRSLNNRPLTIALVGPTGVGKTTTVAKLAATFKLRQHRRVGLITADTYRIAAVEQLRTYADIIGLPLHVAMTPADMSDAIQRLRESEVILIDTAGRSQNDEARLVELRQMIAAAQVDEVHLVLSSTASEKALLREAEAFAQVGIDRVVLTKLDEAVSFGVLINVMQRVGKQLSFLTTGQEVPDHLEPGRPQRLAELVLGGDVRA